MALCIMNGEVRQHGFAYMALLVAIAGSLLLLSVAMPDKYHQGKREREAQLLFAGQQYQMAIERFYQNRFVTIKRYPNNLQELMMDNRNVRPQYHLRRLYPDPMTVEGDWGLVLNEQDQIMGVYSLSDQTLIRTRFHSERIRVSNPAGARYYSDLKFVYLPTVNLR
ncbi:MAG: type II secretion system protein [Methylophaga sp.]|nr:type II secretion system protein [Methylophaga sp.]